MSVVVQPDGRLMVTDSGYIVVYDADDDEIEAYFVERAAESASHAARREIDLARSHPDGWGLRVKSFAYAVAEHNEQAPDDPWPFKGH